MLLRGSCSRRIVRSTLSNLLLPGGCAVAVLGAVAARPAWGLAGTVARATAADQRPAAEVVDPAVYRQATLAESPLHWWVFLSDKGAAVAADPERAGGPRG